MIKGNFCGRLGCRPFCGDFEVRETTESSKTRQTSFADVRYLVRFFVSLVASVFRLFCKYSLGLNSLDKNPFLVV